MIPSDQTTFSDEDFLEMLNEEIQYFGVPHLLRTHEEYLLTFEDIPVTAGKSEYPIPDRAIGNKLRDVAYVDSAGSYFELARISVEYLSDYSSVSVSDYPSSFYLKDNKVVLVDGLPTQGVVRMFFFLKPNKLVADKYAGVVTGIDTITGVISLSNFPTSFSSTTLFDFVGAVSPNRVLKYDVTALSSNNVTKTVTFSPSDIPSELRVGDYINIQGQTIVPQLPEELHPILAQRVTIAALEALGDSEGTAIAQRKLDKMEVSSNDLIDNRVEGAPEKIVNRHSPLQASTSRFQSKNRGRY
jgi:hypothetical protein